MKIYDHGLYPLLLQNPYSKYILAIKKLSVDRFSKSLQVLLRQIEIYMLTRKYLTCPPSAKNSLRKFSIRSQILHIKLCTDLFHMKNCCQGVTVIVKQTFYDQLGLKNGCVSTNLVDPEFLCQRCSFYCHLGKIKKIQNNHENFALLNDHFSISLVV